MISLSKNLIILLGFCLYDYASSSTPTMQPTSDAYSVSRNVLSTLYTATNGNSWRLKKKWLVGRPCTEAWYGVTCSTVTDSTSGLTYTDVTSLVLQENNLRNSLPSELGLLSGLSTNLRFEGNSLTGSLPSEIGMLTNLKSIVYLWGNSFQGLLPSELGRWSLLTRNFKVSKNKFTGSIPSELGQLTGLSIEFKCNLNSFSGKFPSQLGRLTALSYTFDGSDNQFCGSIPHQVAALASHMTLGFGLSEGNGFGTICPEDLITPGPTSLPTAVPTMLPTTEDFRLSHPTNDVSLTTILIVILCVLGTFFFGYLGWRVYDERDWGHMKFIPNTNLREGEDYESWFAYMLRAFFSCLYISAIKLDRCLGYIALNAVYKLWEYGFIATNPFERQYQHEDEEEEDDSDDELNDDWLFADEDTDEDQNDGPLMALMKDKKNSKKMKSQFDSEESANLFGESLNTINEEETEEEEEEEEAGGVKMEGGRSSEASRGKRSDGTMLPGRKSYLRALGRRRKRESGEDSTVSGGGGSNGANKTKSSPKKSGGMHKGSGRLKPHHSLGGFVKRLAFGESLIPKARKKTVVAMEMGVTDVTDDSSDLARISELLGEDLVEDFTPTPKSNPKYNF